MISEYTEGMRNARVFNMENGNYQVLFWDGNQQEEHFCSFPNQDLAEIAAEDWVLAK